MYERGTETITREGEGLKESPQPESKEAVRSFLGMVGYLSKFIDKYASITAPLRKLTEKDVKFKWGPTDRANSF